MGKSFLLLDCFYKMNINIWLGFWLVCYCCCLSLLLLVLCWVCEMVFFLMKKKLSSWFVECFKYQVIIVIIM
ncbi:hypothetical protein DLAC_11508 [Tieghemostelium lacteum]|uniref:Uncharacterized protein n=1 Tax=Tieghemostelium lacteum TaxID=361077 RepID=A0A152A5D7_TIELA|nr:hypothetical protein DLAC_11508 [Tieghemostelium lacteum]|eukprot:KYR01295.1 hypothetical protein DLAC_11508 [Tieghemostelium lacteum]